MGLKRSRRHLRASGPLEPLSVRVCASTAQTSLLTQRRSWMGHELSDDGKFLLFEPKLVPKKYVSRINAKMPRKPMIGMTVGFLPNTDLLWDG